MELNVVIFTLNITHLNGQELAVINIIRMEGKLIIAHPHHHNKRSVCYQISQEGIKYSEAYTNIRSKLIKEMFNQEDIEELINITQALQKIRGFYIKSINSFLYNEHI